MCRRLRYFQIGRDLFQAIARNNQILSGQLDRINCFVGQPRQAQSFEMGVDEGEIKSDIVADERGILDKRNKFLHHLVNRPAFQLQQFLSNPVDQHGLRINRSFGYDQRMIGINDVRLAQPFRRDFNNTMPLGRFKPGCFNIDDNEFILAHIGHIGKVYPFFSVAASPKRPIEMGIKREHPVRLAGLLFFAPLATMEGRTNTPTDGYMAESQSTQKTTIEKVPPQNLEAEQAVLGSLLIDKEAVTRIADILSPSDFYRDSHRFIFEAMLDLYTRREPIDLLSLSNKLEEAGRLETVGGRSYLATLTNIVPTAGNVVHYANVVQKKATLRRLIESASEIASMGFHEENEVDFILDKAEQSLFSVSQKYLKQNFVPIKELLTDAFERMDELHRESGKLRGLPSGFPDLDNLLAGFQKSDLIILAARPSVGKTSLALDFARLAAIKHKAAVAIFSLEMSKEQLIDRLLCSEARISLWKFRTGRLTAEGENDDFAAIGHAMGKLSEANIYIDDSPLANVMEIRTKARRLKSEANLDLIIVDYLQLMEGRGLTDNRVQEVAEITRGLKAVARELQVPVIGLSQLSRAVEMSKPAIPKLAHLRESGSIEQDADVVMFIYRKMMDRNYRREDIRPEEANLVEVHIAKHRNGPTGLVKLRFNEHSVCFESDIGERFSPTSEEAAPF